MPHLAREVDQIAVIRSMFNTHPNHEPALFQIHSGRLLPGRLPRQLYQHRWGQPLQPRQLGLCCGLIGVAFALLALDRIDPRGGWRQEARAIAARVIAEPRFEAPNGLFHGHPGLVCLALDLVGDEVRGFPAVEG